jgi:branched-chain amino acid transport system substrate-binding protein
LVPQECQIAKLTDGWALRSGCAQGRRPSWAARRCVADIRYFVDAFSISSTQGKTAFFDTDDRNEYGGFDTAIVVQRDNVAFMIKTLVPLFLLVLVVFATLFFPPSLSKERTTIPVTGILTSAVLLISIGNQLPSLGYTMALEYIFYVFFAL